MKKIRFITALIFACAWPEIPSSAHARAHVNLEVDTSRPIHATDPRFLSFTIDTALLVGGKWWGETAQKEVAPLDFTQPRLKVLARALSPAVFRVGGTAADRLYYDFSNATSKSAPKGFDGVLTANRWDELYEFSTAAGLDLFFTLNASPAARDSEFDWNPAQARALFEHIADKKQHIPFFELGNELNAYWLHHGLFNQPSGERYARDYARARSVISDFFGEDSPQLAGPASVYWPVLGEPLSWLFGILDSFLESSRTPVEILTWHYYPTQSSRCSFGVRRTSAKKMLAPETLDEIAVWSEKIRNQRDRLHPDAQLWLGETGPAQCGGEPGVSDRFISGLWWLDHLGMAAKLGNSVVLRQSLVGADYGMLSSRDFSPNPDFWLSLLWKKLMGEKVLEASANEHTRPGNKTHTRVYAHCTAQSAPEYRPGAVTFLAINTHWNEPSDLELPKELTGPALAFSIDSQGPRSKIVRLNGTTLTLAAEDQLPPLEGQAIDPEQTLILPPLSAVFIVFQDASAPACQRINLSN